MLMFRPKKAKFLVPQPALSGKPHNFIVAPTTWLPRFNRTFINNKTNLLGDRKAAASH
jgi:hypothetical protein